MHLPVDLLCWCVGATGGMSWRMTCGRFWPRECLFFSSAGFGESGFCVVCFRWPGMWRRRIDVEFWLHLQKKGTKKTSTVSTQRIPQAIYARARIPVSRQSQNSTSIRLRHMPGHLKQTTQKPDSPKPAELKNKHSLGQNLLQDILQDIPPVAPTRQHRRSTGRRIVFFAYIGPNL
jgi:hypothetical protein